MYNKFIYEIEFNHILSITIFIPNPKGQTVEPTRKPTEI